ncbi:hypothetical protein [Rhodopirellula sp. P2]|uniref:hypothetical protein n=1 Tax=Rhodopirellula sp. P2 TaxID=2127060 RepID=UPI0023680714|nr:hypothetical protein [Rhodopirellula sp. P2]WDQ18891.1 hypothetical protein PSR62_10185 [Rhodopirellula sp. P2]
MVTVPQAADWIPFSENFSETQCTDDVGFIMKCHELAEKVSQLRPELSPTDVARLCLMILNQEVNPSRLDDPAVLNSVWQNVSFRFEAATDQHAAVSHELDTLLNDGPVEFSPDQLWTLLRAVKVQGQMLDLYTKDVSFA